MTQNQPDGEQDNFLFEHIICVSTNGNTLGPWFCSKIHFECYLFSA